MRCRRRRQRFRLSSWFPSMMPAVRRSAFLRTAAFICMEKGVLLHVAQVLEDFRVELHLFVPVFSRFLGAQVSRTGVEVTVLNEFLIDGDIQGLLDRVVKIFYPVGWRPLLYPPGPHQAVRVIEAQLRSTRHVRQGRMPFLHDNRKRL